MKTSKAKLGLLALTVLMSAGIFAQSETPKTDEKERQITATPIGDGGNDLDDPFLLSRIEENVKRTSVYPNPGKGVIRFNGQVPEGTLTVKVVNLTGQVEYAGVIDGANLEAEKLDLSHLRRGIYLIHLGDKVLKYQKL